MPLMHCMDCHHEWESTSDNSLCGWCGGGAYVLDPKTPLEKFCDDLKDPEYREKIIKSSKKLSQFWEPQANMEPEDKRWRGKKK